jgi:hypothetical protein
VHFSSIRRIRDTGWGLILFWIGIIKSHHGIEMQIANWFDRIQTWALEEARRRLEAEGILKEPETKS